MDEAGIGGEWCGLFFEHPIDILIHLHIIT